MNVSSSKGEKNILIADSGATKTDWCVARGEKMVHRFASKGISPIYQSREEIIDAIRTDVAPHLHNQSLDAICFYGSGCIPEKTETVRQSLYAAFPVDEICVYSDLIAAAHALCGRSSGIACILGTGSNSCEWNGTEIVHQISPLGFILGDEGSGAHLGKLLVGDALKNQLADGMKERLLEQYKLDVATIIDKVYRQPFPSRFLATLAPFLLENIHEPTVHDIIRRSLTDFFERNVMHYDIQSNKVHFVGSIAFYFADILKEIAAEKGIQIGKIEQSPMSGLVEYYAEE